MYKMKLLLCFISLICIIKISTIHSQEATSNQNGLGISSCSYEGDIDIKCNTVGIPLTNFPDSCTSFVFNGLMYNDSKVSQKSYPTQNDALLDRICDLGKKVYVMYHRESYCDWISILATLASNDTNVLNEAKAINAYVQNHRGITGLLLLDLEPDLQNSPELVGLTEYLKKYIEIIKKETGLEVALIFRAYYFFLYYEQQAVPWLDFKSLDPCVEFYLFSLMSFYNECTENTRIGGVFPIDGSELYTFEQLSSAIGKSKISAEKSYFSYVLVPSSGNESSFCVLNNERLCKFPNESKSWCADTQETLFKKGQWFKNHGIGFNAHYLNIDDPHGCCGCGPFPGYNAILAGFNGSLSAPSCPLFDRI